MSGRKWTPDEVSVLLAEYPNTPTRLLAERFGRTERQVYMKAGGMGLKKSVEYLASPFAGRIRPGSNIGGEARFRKGRTPWNKGRPGSTGTHPNCKRTHFRKGQRTGCAADMWKPIGSERLTKDGTLQRKVNNDMPPKGRWKAVHAIVWEQAHGPIPNGCVVVFKPGYRTAVASEITTDRLELVSRNDLMRRNSYHTRYPKELAQVIQLRGAITRQINKRARREEQNHRSA